MTFLELCNEVLTRLREDKITEDQLDSNPYIRSIMAHVNDAKDRVEDSWQWNALRTRDYVPLGEVVTIPPTSKQRSVYAIPNSSTDNHYILKGLWFQKIDPSYTGINGTQMYDARQITLHQWFQRTAHIDAMSVGQPQEFAVAGTDANGDLNLGVNPVPSLTPAMQPEWQAIVYGVRHQDKLVNATDELLVPSLPVYTLATALASRERGEVGGTPTSELFAIADRHLSDAIAQDSAVWPEETIWFGGIDSPNRTNIRTA